MPSNAASAYQDLLEAKLITAVTTSTTTGVQVKVKMINGVAPTWTTVAHRLKVIQRTATTNKAEVWQVAAGTTQSGQTVTLGTLTRALPLSSGTDFTGSGTAQSFSAGADVFLAWDAHDAAETAKLDIANTFTGIQTFNAGINASGGALLVPVYADATARDAAITVPSNGMIVYLTDTGVLNQYIGGAWTTFASGTTVNASTTVAGKEENATVAEQASHTATGGTGATLVPAVGNLVTLAADGTWLSGAIPTLNTAKLLDGSIGGTGVASPVLGGLLIGGGAGLAMTPIGPGTAGQVPVSNGTTLSMGTAGGYFIPVMISATTSAAAGTGVNTKSTFSTCSYTIPTGKLISNVLYRFDIVGQYTWAAGTLGFSVMLGGSDLFGLAVGTPTGGNTFVITGYILGTAAAGAAASVRGWGSVTTGATDNVVRPSYGANTFATNGDLLIEFTVTFGTGNGGNAAELRGGLIGRTSTTIST